MALFNYHSFYPDRSFFIPEVIQTSSMDCGPAALKSILEGYHISVSYDNLRMACQTDVSGTSIDTIEDIAYQLGLDAQQVIIQTDHLLLKETDALPAIVVVRLPDGFSHFVVVWRRLGQMVQIMDPAIGRLWVTQRKFIEMVYPYSYHISKNIWKDYTSTDIFCDPLHRRMADLYIRHSEINRLILNAQTNEDWRAVATLDASVRLLTTIIKSGIYLSGESAEKIIKTYYDSAFNQSDLMIPEEYFSVIPPIEDQYKDDSLLLKGALLIHISGKRHQAHTQNVNDQDTLNALSDEQKTAIHKRYDSPENEFYKFMRLDHALLPSILLIALFLASLNISIEALILLSFMTIAGDLSQIVGQQGIELQSIFIFFVALLLIESPIQAANLKLGRRFEIAMRLRFFSKIPKLNDHFFQSRLKSDMIQRIHDMRLIRKMPTFLSRLFRVIFQIIITVIGIIWLMPIQTIMPIMIGIFSIGFPLAALPFLKERDLQFRTFTGALAKYCLDGLMGMTPLRSHSAENALRYEHEKVLCEWKKSGFDYFGVQLVIFGSAVLLNMSLSIILIYDYLSFGGHHNCVFLLIYWVLNLTELGMQLQSLVGSYPGVRNRILRILEPINANPHKHSAEDDTPERVKKGETSYATIDIKNVSVMRGGSLILKDINISIQPGEHVAIVGPSGAGKSSIVKLLLGLYDAYSGDVFIDNQKIASAIHSLRRDTVWIDPCVHLWNQSLFDNILYGNDEDNTSQFGLILEQTELINILNSFPKGKDTLLGEEGRLVSGGEGQRVRLGRGLYKKNVRFVILDEPFRGLSRNERHLLLKKALEIWKSQTLIFISHDVQESLDFHRVIVIEKGTIIEDGAPERLIKENSRYQSIMRQEERSRTMFLKEVQWKKYRIENGKIHN